MRTHYDAIASPVYEAARAAAAHGISVVPAAEDGTKRPAVAWLVYRRRLPAPAELLRWFEEERRAGLCFVCGAVSGGLEMLEFEDRAAYAAFKLLAEDAGLGVLLGRIEGGCSSASPGGGVHLLLRSDEVAANTVLAKRPKRPEERRHPRDTEAVVAETRGEGGVTIEPPSGGSVHPSGRPYRQLRGGVATIARILPGERRALLRLVRTLDRRPPVPPPQPRPPRPTAIGPRPGDTYNAAADVQALLEAHGWAVVGRRGGTDHLRRPGKDRGVSATVNHAGSGLFYPFTSSTDFEPNRGYSPFAVFAVLECGGDFRLAARRLAERGFGGPRLRVGSHRLRTREARRG